MSISAVGGVSPLAFQSIASTGKPESAEVAGAPDHDGDSDDAATKAGQVSSRSVDLHA